MNDDVAVIRPARVKIGGLWVNKTKQGKTYLSGTLGYDAMIEVWPNVKREGTKDPDYTINIVQKIKKSVPEAEIKHSIGDVPF